MNEIPRKSERIRYADIFRGISIILVVIGHSGSPFTRFIYLFHVTSFIFLSGYLQKIETTSLTSQIKKKLKTLYIPFIKYMFIFLALNYLFVVLRIYSENTLSSLKNIIIAVANILLFGNGAGELLGALWFITLLFETSLIFITIEFLARKLKLPCYSEGVAIFALFIFGYVLIQMNLSLPRYLDTSLLVLPIFYFGVLYRKYESRIPTNIPLFFLSITMLLILNQLGGIDLSKKIIVNPIFFLTATLSGVYMILFISKKISQFKISEYLSTVGVFSFDIMALHFLAFKLVTLAIIVNMQLNISNLSAFPVISIGEYNWIFYSLVGVILPIGIISLFKKMKLSNSKVTI